MFSSWIIAISFFSFTIVTRWLNTIVASLTITYHGVILYLSCRRSAKSVVSTGGADGPSTWRVTSAAYTRSSTKVVMLLFGTWVVALCFSMQATVTGPMALMGLEPNAPLNRGIQAAESTLLVLQTLIIGSMLVYCIENRRATKASIGNTRALDEKRLFLPSPVVCRTNDFKHKRRLSLVTLFRKPRQIDRFQCNR